MCVNESMCVRGGGGGEARMSDILQIYLRNTRSNFRFGCKHLVLILGEAQKIKNVGFWVVVVGWVVEEVPFDNVELTSRLSG